MCGCTCAYAVRRSLFEILFVSFRGKKGVVLQNSMWVDGEGGGGGSERCREEGGGVAPVPKTKRQEAILSLPLPSQEASNNHIVHSKLRRVCSCQRLPSPAVACRRLLSLIE